jgi:hypothetical protein
VSEQSLGGFGAGWFARTKDVSRFEVVATLLGAFTPAECRRYGAHAGHRFVELRNTLD